MTTGAFSSCPCLIVLVGKVFLPDPMYFGQFFSTFWGMGETNSRVGLIVMFKGDKTTLEVGTPCKKMGVPFLDDDKPGGSFKPIY